VGERVPRVLARLELPSSLYGSQEEILNDGDIQVTRATSSQHLSTGLADHPGESDGLEIACI
jgi:hypothetical protein